MKKIFICISVLLLIIIMVGVIVVRNTIIHVQLPHGAVLHVLPAKNSHSAHGAVVICPGGGYTYLERWKEGYWWFPFFYGQGYAVALLEYRMPDHDHTVPLTDGTDAILMMREHAEEWDFEKDRVGIVGFSAGGHLASTMMVSENDSIRPDFGILFYPVISMKKDLTHKGSHDHLLGENASEQLENQYSNELHVSSQAPPAYITLSGDDQKVNPQNSIRFHEEMQAHRCLSTLRVYPTGGHGWGYQYSFPYHRQMLDELADWLRKNSNNKQMGTR